MAIVMTCHTFDKCLASNYSQKGKNKNKNKEIALLKYVVI
jgi:hypothetical protein